MICLCLLKLGDLHTGLGRSVGIALESALCKSTYPGIFVVNSGMVTKMLELLQTELFLSPFSVVIPCSKNLICHYA